MDWAASDVDYAEGVALRNELLLGTPAGTHPRVQTNRLEVSAELISCVITKPLVNPGK
jgi:hypothetical protein